MKPIKSYESFLRLNEAVTINTTRYERSYGKKPKGLGMWAFYFDKTGGEPIFTPQSMNYTDAIKWAKEQAKERGETMVYVGESLNESEAKTTLDDYGEGKKVHFKDGEVWVVVKKGMRGAGTFRKFDEITIKPHNKLAKDRNISLPIDVNLAYLNANVDKIV
jgi:hypothetical protein